jgi:hypothetical protein
VLEPVDGLVGEPDRELDLDRSRDRPDRDGESARPEEVDHAVVLGQDLGDERGDVVQGGLLRELAQQDRADAPALEVVGDREADLGSTALHTEVLGAADHPPLVAALEHQ